MVTRRRPDSSASREPDDAFGDLRAAIEEAERARRERLYARIYHGHQNHQRELRGLEPLPLPPELRETREDVLEILRETIPSYRQDRGWQTEEARAFLDQWEDGCLQRLSELSKGDDE